METIRPEVIDLGDADMNQSGR